MNLEIPDDIVRATHLTPDELRVEIAVMLFERDRLTLGQASILAGKKQPEFQQVLAGRKISLHYDVEDFRKDLQTLRELGAR